jgi:hypothetical protein
MNFALQDSQDHRRLTRNWAERGEWTGTEGYTDRSTVQNHVVIWPACTVNTCDAFSHWASKEPRWVVVISV